MENRRGGCESQETERWRDKVDKRKVSAPRTGYNKEVKVSVPKQRALEQASSTACAVYSAGVCRSDRGGSVSGLFPRTDWEGTGEPYHLPGPRGSSRDHAGAK